MIALLALALLVPQATITPCADGSAAAREASEALARLARQMDAATPASDADPLAKALEALPKHRCFALAAEHAHPLPDATTPTPALLRWWRDGGHDWLASYLGPGPDVALPPDVRKVLTQESAPEGHALAPLLCPVGDAMCGRATRGWMRRADLAFEQHAAREQRRGEDGGAPALKDALAACWKTAQSKPAADRYLDWRACVDGTRPRRAALPVGAFRAPTDGWLVLRGRRGHYRFCDELRVYDLVSGAAYVVKSCSGLALRPDGKVDGEATAAGRAQTMELGRLPLDNLREAAWMTMLASEAEDAVRTEAFYARLPEGLRREIPEGTGSGGIGGMSGWFSSAQTTLSWAWIRQDRVQASGTLRWPDSSEAPVAHAAELVRVAEAGLQPGCPPTPLPRGMTLGPDASRVSPIDASAAELRDVDAKNLVALRQLAWKRCQKTR